MKVIPVAAFLLFLQPAFAQYNWTELNRALDENRKILGNNLVCLVWKDDSLVFKKEMGAFDARTAAPIASCSKWLTAALVMQFVDEGKLSLGDYVSKYIPEFGTQGKGNIRIRDCLCHMTGISDDDKFLRRILERRKYSSLGDEVLDFAKRKKRAEPGTDFWYGNIGLNIAGRILELISGKKFETLAQEKLFGPLGMTRTSFADPKGYPANPSGGARSTAEDYMKFLVMLLNKGMYKGKRILTETAVTRMMEAQDQPGQIVYAPKSAQGYCYALGSWVVENSRVPFPKPNRPSVPPIPDDTPEEIIKATCLASPGLFGTWPMIDYCRGYAYIVFVKNLLGEERAGIHIELKKIIDRQLFVIADCTPLR